MSAPSPADDIPQLRSYVRIFKKLDRQTAAELVAALAADPELNGRMAITQAAVLVSFGHAMGWAADAPGETS